MTLIMSTWANTAVCEACSGTGRIWAGRRGANDPERIASDCRECGGAGEIISDDEEEDLKS